MNNKTPPIQLIIADDHEIFRDGLQLMLSKVDNIQLTGGASNGRELIQLVETKKPHVVITDIKMPEMDGIEATQWIKKKHPKTQVVALSMFDDEHLILDMLEAGALGYLLKNSDKQEITDAIETVAAGKSFYCKTTSNKLAKLIALSKIKKEKKEKEDIFNDKELEIIKLICQEKTNKEIAEIIFLSPRTIEGYRMKIMEKMEVKNTVGIVVEAIRLGIYDPDEHLLQS